MSHRLGMPVRRAEYRQNKAGNLDFFVAALERFPLGSNINDILSMLIQFSIILLSVEVK